MIHKRGSYSKTISMTKLILRVFKSFHLIVWRCEDNIYQVGHEYVIEVLGL
jgi:hypothetical protein